MRDRPTAGQVHVAATAFFALFSVVGLALYGLPLYYDFMVREFGWSRTMVTSFNAISKLVVGPIFGFLAGWIVDRFGPRRLMLAGILMAGAALVGLGAVSALWMFYFFYLLRRRVHHAQCRGPRGSRRHRASSRPDVTCRRWRPDPSCLDLTYAYR